MSAFPLQTRSLAEVDPISCAQCGTPVLPPFPRGRLPKYCGGRCRHLANHPFVPLAVADPEHRCGHCREQLLPRPDEKEGYYRRRQFCDDRCQQKTRNFRTAVQAVACPDRRCKRCNGAVLPKPGQSQGMYDQQLYCSDHCKRSVRNGRHYEQQKKAEQRERTGFRTATVPRPAPIVRAATLSDDDAIARFIAERGVTRCPAAFAAPSPQGALSEKDAAPLLAKFEPKWDATINDVVSYLKQHNRFAWSNGRSFKLDGSLCTRADLLRAANELRARNGLIPYRLPNAMAMTA